MDGIQYTVYLALNNLAQKVADGAFGKDDDFDAEAFGEDLDAITMVAE